MSETLKIKLTIADRVYPLTVAASQEAPLRQSAKKIEGMIKQLEQNYAVRDKQDVLAMCALQFAAQVEQTQTTPSTPAETTKIDELIQLIDAHMSTF
ncbi:MAG: cell division protein ZapA [Flavobacteriaceae bacterium]